MPHLKVISPKVHFNNSVCTIWKHGRSWENLLSSPEAVAGAPTKCRRLFWHIHGYPCLCRAFSRNIHDLDVLASVKRQVFLNQTGYQHLRQLSHTSVLPRLRIGLITLFKLIAISTYLLRMSLLSLRVYKKGVQNVQFPQAISRKQWQLFDDIHLSLAVKKTTPSLGICCPEWGPMTLVWTCDVSGSWFSHLFHGGS